MIDDLLAEYKRQLDEQGDYVVSLAAHDFVEQCMQHYSTEFAKWLEIRAEEFVQAELRRLLHVERNRARRLAPVTAFRGAADAFAADPDGEGRQVMEAHYAISHENIWRKLREMTRDDLGFVASQYEMRGKRNQLWAAFFRAIERKVGPDQTVSQVFSEAQIVELQDRILGGK